jgi:hypothetical protein
MDDIYNKGIPYVPHSETRAAEQPHESDKSEGKGMMGRAKHMARSAMHKAREVAEEVRCRYEKVKEAIRTPSDQGTR